MPLNWAGKLCGIRIRDDELNLRYCANDVKEYNCRIITTRCRFITTSKRLKAFENSRPDDNGVHSLAATAGDMQQCGEAKPGIQASADILQLLSIWLGRFPRFRLNFGATP